MAIQSPRPEVFITSSKCWKSFLSPLVPQAGLLKIRITVTFVIEILASCGLKEMLMAQSNFSCLKILS